jgi:hypothetical protein
MEVKPGTRLRSVTCATEVVVIRAPNVEVDVRCGGEPMLSADGNAPERRAVSPAHSGGTSIGKRYTDEALGIEILCTRSGEGSLHLGDRPLLLKDAKPLPASD